MNVQHVGEIFVIITNVLIDAVYRTDADASGIDAIDAEPSYGPRHKIKSSLYKSSLPLFPPPALAGGAGGKLLGLAPFLGPTGLAVRR
jgi:hypothetical protein